MPPELLALIDNPALLVAVLFAGAMIGICVEKFVRWQNRREWQRRKARRSNVAPGPWEARSGAFFERTPDAADQLRTVMQARFTAQPLLNKSEARLFRAMDRMVIELAPPGWQVMMTGE